LGSATDPQRQSFPAQASTSRPQSPPNELNDRGSLAEGFRGAVRSVYHNAIRPAWINKLPERPLAWGGAANHARQRVRHFSRGASRPVAMKLNPTSYLANGPSLTPNDCGRSRASSTFERLHRLEWQTRRRRPLGIIPIPNGLRRLLDPHSRANPAALPRHPRPVQALDSTIATLLRESRPSSTSRRVRGQRQHRAFDPTGST